MMEDMKQTVLIIGSGGREHALAWKLTASPALDKLYTAPGNAGTAALGDNVALNITDPAAVVAFAKEHDINLVVVAPDDALAAGLVDALTAAGIRAFGPTQAAAGIEASKAFAKQLMAETGVPTAGFATFKLATTAKQYLATRPFPQVVKASGLALGKGVIICQNLAEAEAAIDHIMTDKAFGDAGGTVVIEDFLTGREVSLHAFCDGNTAVLFPPAQDHKQIGTGGTGPNTGGMGTYAPVPWMKPALLRTAQATVVEPVLAGLAAQGTPFRGLLYPGLMVDGVDMKVLEYNARFGDPETQSYLRLLETDLLDVLNACIDGTLDTIDITWSDESAVTVVLASEGYPGPYPKGRPITGIEAAEKQPGVVVFQAGTARKDGQLVTNGGRVLGVSATGATLAEARDRAYAAVKLIAFEGMQWRTDIAESAL
jgi:phosphoribosylamine---glycine ligase